MSESIEWWSVFWAVSGLVLGGAVAIVAFVAFFFSWKAGKLKDAEFKLYKEDSAKAVASADATAADANKIAAKANERAANLEKEAADSRLELMKLQQKLAWRIIEEPARNAFFNATATVPKAKIQISYLSNSEEVLNFTAQLVEMFREAGYDCPKSFDEMGSFMPMGLAIGLVITVRDESHQEGAQFQHALMRAGIEASVRFISEIGNDDILLEIGAKPSNK